jgi:hypothetical protein
MGQKIKKRKSLELWAYSVAKIGIELLNNHGEAARDLQEHIVAEAPVRLPRDLLLGVPRRHLQLQQRVKVIWVFQNRTQTPHFSSQIRLSETTKHAHTVCCGSRLFVGSSVGSSIMASENRAGYRAKVVEVRFCLKNTTSPI